LAVGKEDGAWQPRPIGEKPAIAKMGRACDARAAEIEAIFWSDCQQTAATPLEGGHALLTRRQATT
jgi:hypothetical protein